MQLAKEAGYKAIVIFGEPGYYPKHGFKTCDNFGITTADGGNHDAFMGIELVSDGLRNVSGKFYEDDVFKNPPEIEVDEFDKNFPYMEKLRLPGQWGFNEEDGLMYNTILFDLDGTLSDPSEGITKSVQYALKHFEIYENDLKELEKFIGPPLKEEFMKQYGMDEAMAEVALQKYRERFSRIGINENILLPGIDKMLASLKETGRVLGVASSKPTFYVEQILETFGIREYFTVVVGSEMDGRRSDKKEVIEEALSQLNLTEEQRKSVIMIGDREHDVIGAKRNQIPCIGVLMGFGSREELEAAGAKYVVSTVDELYKLLGGEGFVCENTIGISGMEGC